MQPTLKCDCLVIGGGVVGLAIAAVASQMCTTILLEREKTCLHHTSSRNSGVVHAGIYYPQNSLKTRFCMKGNQNIWNLQNHSSGAFAHVARRCGKWIGAVNAAEEDELAKLAHNMKCRNISFRWLSQEEIKEKEPLVAMTSVVESSATGIVNVHALGSLFQRMIEDSATNSIASVNTEVTNLSTSGSSGAIVATCVDGTTREVMTIEAQKVVASMGNFTNDLWNGIIANCDPLATHTPPPSITYHCKGRYVGYRGKTPVSRLVYPCPLPNLKGLGVHSVINMDGHVLFGPDALYVDESKSSDYSISTSEEAQMIQSSYEAIRKYIPSIERERLFADFAGVRPKLSKEGEAARDFQIDEIKLGTHGGLIILSGIESPGLTASTAIAEHVATLLNPERAKNGVLDQLPWANR